jgi:hypothetical protein
MIKKISALIIVSLLLSFNSFSQIILEKILLLDNKIEILAPKGFIKMTDDMLLVKYPNTANKPNFVLTDESGTVNLLYTYTTTTMDDNGIPGYADELIKGLTSNRKDILIIDDGILLQDGKNIGYIKFISQAKDQKVFNDIFYISLDNRLLLFSFNCIQKWRDEWEQKADEIANSIRVKPIE